jgi:hypothetical protein
MARGKKLAKERQKRKRLALRAVVIAIAAIAVGTWFLLRIPSSPDWVKTSQTQASTCGQKPPAVWQGQHAWSGWTISAEYCDPNYLIVLKANDSLQAQGFAGVIRETAKNQAVAEQSVHISVPGVGEVNVILNTRTDDLVNIT